MTREAARDGFESFLEDAVTATREEFSVARALKGTGLGPGGVVIDRLRRDLQTLERRVVEPELATYRDRSLRQFDVVLEYAAGDEPIDAYADEILAHDGYYEALDPDVPDRTRIAVTDAIIARNRRLGDAIEPIVERPENEFWPAVTAAFDRAEAVDLVERAFPFTDVLREFPDAFVFEARIDPGEVLGGVFAGTLPAATVDYSEEAARAMRRAEHRIIEATKREVSDRFTAE